MRRLNRIDGNAPQEISGVYTFKGKIVEMIYRKAEEIENKTGGYCSIERAIHSLLLELDTKRPIPHLSHP